MLASVAENTVSAAGAATYTFWLAYEQQGRPPRVLRSDTLPVVHSAPTDRVVRHLRYVMECICSSATVCTLAC